MHHTTRTRLLVVFVPTLLIAVSVALFVANRLLPKVLAQAPPASSTLDHSLFLPLVTGDTATTTNAEDVEIATLTPGDFDNTIFILAPAVRPQLFVDCVDNPYFPLIPGMVYEYETETEEGIETTTVTVTDQTKKILGITATVVHDVVELEGELIEDTFDWYAQDQRGHVWYLGEDVSNYEDGQLVDKAGSWEAGVNGAVPGIVMLGQPFVGDVYRQEYFQGEAEDMAGVLSLNEAVAVAYGDFDDVLQTADYNPLEGTLEHKFYAPGLGLIKEEGVDTEEITELTSVSPDPTETSDNDGCGTEDDDEDHEPAG